MSSSAENKGSEPEAHGRLRTHEAPGGLFFHANPQPMWIMDEGTLAFLAVNEACVRAYGFARDRFAKMTLRDICANEEGPALLETLRAPSGAGVDALGVWRLRRCDGATIFAEITTQKIPFGSRPARLVLAHDVTRSILADEALRRNEAMGRFASAIAHDFNNALVGVMGYADFALTQMQREDRLFELIEKIRRSAERATGVARQLAVFGRRPVSEVRVVSPNELLEGLRRMLAAACGDRVKLEVSLQLDAGLVRADPAEIEQAVLSLCHAARDSMPAGGRIWIGTANRDGSVVVTVSASGAAGAPQPSALVQAIVDQHGGRIEVEGARGASAIHIFLPRCDSGRVAPPWTTPATGTPAPSPTPVPVPGPTPVPAAVQATARAPLPRGTETILLVESEEIVRSVQVQALERLGYRVLAAASGPEAVELAERQAGPVDLFVAEAGTPGAWGHDAASELEARRPDVRVLFTAANAGVAPGGTPFLAKPFSVVALAAKVREVLDERAACAA